MSTVLNRRDRRKLQALSVADWEILSDLYTRDWPRHIFTYNTLKNYIEWAKRNPRTDEIRILTIDDNWRQHGTFILEDRNDDHYNVSFDTLPQKNGHELILTALRCLETAPAYSLTAYVDYVRPAAEEYLREIGVRLSDCHTCSTVMYYMPKELGLKVELRPIPGFIFRPLEEKHAKHINDLWPHKYPGSDYLILRIVRYNLTFGAFTADTDELAAWVVQCEYGTIGILQVEDAFKRRGLGESLVRLLIVELAKNNLDATANVMDENLPSRRIFEKLNFDIIDRVTWCDKPELSCEATSCDKSNQDQLSSEPTITNQIESKNDTAIKSMIDDGITSNGILGNGLTSTMGINYEYHIR